MFADEMFQNRGYVKTDEVPNGHIQYKNSEYGDTITVMDKAVEFSDVDGGYCFLVGKEDILACAQLIKEQEKNPETEWFIVERKLPELRKEVLAEDKNGRRFVGYIDGVFNAYTGKSKLNWYLRGIRRTSYIYTNKVVKWRELPE